MIPSEREKLPHSYNRWELKWPPWQMNTPEVFCFIILTAFMSPVSLILVIFFPRSQDKSRKTLLFHPNKSPHTEVNNINTYVSGVSAGALLKLIFQNVFSALPAATGEPSHPQLPDSEHAPCGMAFGQESWHWMLSAGFLGSISSQVKGKNPSIPSRSFSSPLLAPPRRYFSTSVGTDD